MPGVPISKRQKRAANKRARLKVFDIHALVLGLLEEQQALPNTRERSKFIGSLRVMASSSEIAYREAKELDGETVITLEEEAA